MTDPDDAFPHRTPSENDETVTTTPQPPRHGLLGGLATLLGTHTGNQFGAAIGASAFPVIGPVGVVAVRQLVAATLLMILARPRIRRLTWPQWWPILLLAGVFAVMNLSLYTAIDRIGLGLAITLEFLGPLAVALIGARGVIELGCALGAAVGVYVLVLPGPSTDWLGIALALVAGGCWAAYIILSRLVGGRLSGLQAPALATSISALGYLPVVVVLALGGRLDLRSVAAAGCAGLLCSAVPYAMDLIVLRTMSARLFGVVMSINPPLAALTGWLILGQQLHRHEWVGIAIIAVINAVAVATAGRRSPVRETEPTAGLVGLRDATMEAAAAGGPAGR